MNSKNKNSLIFNTVITTILSLFTKFNSISIFNLLGSLNPDLHILSLLTDLFIGRYLDYSLGVSFIYLQIYQPRVLLEIIWYSLYRQEVVR